MDVGWVWWRDVEQWVFRTACLTIFPYQFLYQWVCQEEIPTDLQYLMLFYYIMNQNEVTLSTEKTDLLYEIKINKKVWKLFKVMWFYCNRMDPAILNVISDFANCTLSFLRKRKKCHSTPKFFSTLTFQFVSGLYF